MSIINYKEAIEWLNSLKKQIGKSEHRDLWNFEEPIDKIIELLKPLLVSHGDLIDIDIDVKNYISIWNCSCSEFGKQKVMAIDDLKYLPVLIKAEVEDADRT